MAIPALPALMDTSYANAIAPGCKTIDVPNGGDLQQALNKAKQGDLVRLAQGATYTGNFTLPAAKGGPKTIRIEPASLTPEGTRVSIASAATFPKIVTPNAGAAIQVAPGAGNWRLTNVEVTSGSTPVNGYLIGLGTGNETDRNDFPHHIVIDRSYIHGSAANGGRRGVMFSGNYQAVIDSYLSDWKEVGADTQAIAGWTGFGPYKIVNNYLEGAGENVLFGGASTFITNLTPSDIEIRGNHFFKPLGWKVGDPGYLGTHWAVKNSLELKHAQRVLVTGNVFENCWADEQTGYAILFTVRNQTGGNPWSVVQDITYKRNVLKNSAAGMNFLGQDDLNTSQVTSRILVEDNLHYDITESTEAHFLIQRGVVDLQINHNTAIGVVQIIASAGGAPEVRFKYSNNIALHNQYGIKGDGQNSGNDTIAAYFPGSEVLRNVIVMNTGDFSSSYPSNNYYPANVAAVDFENYAADDYRLKATSPYIAGATDGTQVGTRYFG